jgi:hypothetical protein
MKDLGINLIFIGLGGTGSILLEPLLRLLSYHPIVDLARVTLVDGDEYALSNSTRQLFDPAAVGQNKAEYQAERLRAIAERLRAIADRAIVAVPNYLNERGLTKLLRKRAINLVISCVDNDASRLSNVVALEASGLDFIFITGGNALDFGQVQSYGLIQTTRLGLNPRSYNQGLAEPTDTIPRKGGCMLKQVSEPQLITANFMSAGAILVVLQNFLDGKGLAHSVAFNVREYKMCAL